MKTTSYWIDSVALPRFPRPTADLVVDVVVVGGGITGVTTAALMKRAGLTVALIERERFALIDTGHTTAHLTSVTDLRLHEIAKTFSPEVARSVWDAGAAAIDQIVTLIRQEDIACDFRWVPGYLHAPLSGAGREAVQDLKKAAELAGKIGLGVTYLDKIPAFDVPGIKFPQQAIFHPRKYLAALLKTIAGLLSPLSGHVDRGALRRRDIAYLPQLAEIDRSFPISVADTVLLGGWAETGLFGGVSKALRHRAEEALEAVGLGGFERRPIGSLSAGQFQRVLFARLLLQNGRVIMLDEPFTALDSKTTLDLVDVVAHAWRAFRRGRDP